jgi:tetratricopeptide (TPR) repeat protein
MRTNFLLFYCIVVLSSVLYQEGYKELYEKGFMQMKQKHYNDAIALLKKAYRLKNHSQIAYCIAYAYNLMEDFDSSAKYAR